MSADTLAMGDSVVQDTDAPPYVRAARLATFFARQHGHKGTYTTHRPEKIEEPPLEIWWVDGERSERVAFEIAHQHAEDELAMIGDAPIAHQPFVDACRHICPDRLSCVGEGLS